MKISVSTQITGSIKTVSCSGSIDLTWVSGVNSSSAGIVGVGLGVAVCVGVAVRIAVWVGVGNDVNVGADVGVGVIFVFTCTRTTLEHEELKSHMAYLKSKKGLLGHQRSRTANKLKNPRIAQISYHSFCHWKATQLYHQTKDVLFVMKFLGHRNVKNTLVYIDLEKLTFPNGGDD